MIWGLREKSHLKASLTAMEMSQACIMSCVTWATLFEKNITGVLT